MIRRISALVIAAIASCLLSVTFAQTSSAYTFFQAPSKNIGCLISKKGVRCDIRQKSWRPPPKPKYCMTDWGYGLLVSKKGKAKFFCAGDSAAGMGRIVQYGQSIRRGRFKCTSKSNGMLCKNLRNRHGFKLSKEHARRF